MDYAIEARDLRKTYPGDVRALDGLSFAVEEGTVFGLLGPNGAGKSTTVKILTTLAAAGRGHGARGRPRRRCATPTRCAARSAPSRRGRASTARPPAARTCACRARSTACAAASSSSARRRAARALRPDRRRRPHRAHYSGGMQRRLDIAMALVHRPERAVPRRAHHRPRPRGARRHVGARSPACAASTG